MSLIAKLVENWGMEIALRELAKVPRNDNSFLLRNAGINDIFPTFLCLLYFAGNFSERLLNLAEISSFIHLIKALAIRSNHV